MSAKLHIIWASIYLILFLTDFHSSLSTLLFVFGVMATYLVLDNWNHSTAEITTRKAEFRKIVRPKDMAEVALTNKYRIPFFFTLWAPLAFALCVFGRELATEVGFGRVLVALFLTQLILFDFINVDIRTRMLLPKTEGK